MAWIRFCWPSALGLWLLTCSSVWAAEVILLSGAEHRGPLLHLDANTLKMRTESGDELSFKLEEVLFVKLREGYRPLPAHVPALRVRLVDGSQVVCQGVGLVGTQAELRLFSGQRLSVPLTSLSAILCEAQVPKNVEEFDALVASKPRVDVVRLLSRDGKTVNAFEGALGDADAAGETIRFTPEGGEATQLSLARVRALWFSRPPLIQPAAIGWVRDLYQNRFAIASVELAGDTLRLKTPTGLTLTLAEAMVAELDLSLGKQAYLSDLDPLTVETGSVWIDVWSKRWRRDRSLTGSPLTLGQRSFAKGLALQARTVLEYDVTGFNTFRAVVGIDNQLAVGQAVISVQGDGKELLTLPVRARAEAPPEIELKITGVKRLKLIVDYGPDMDLGAHVILGDARVLR